MMDQKRVGDPELAKAVVELLEGGVLEKAGWERRLHELEGRHGDEVYSNLFFILANLDFSPGEAASHWRGLLETWNEVNQAVGQPIDIRVAILHYFLEIDRKLKNPTIVEMRILREVRESAILDGLTHVYNYRYFRDRIDHEVKREERSALSVSLLMVDVDHFKAFNDCNGHLHGNVALQELAALMKSVVRDIDVVTRYGGEEFAVILCETRKGGALLVAEKIRRLVEETPFPGEETQPGGTLTVSVGVATSPIDATDSQNLIAKADSALFKSKNEGKNRVTPYSEDRREFVRFDSHLIGEVRVMEPEGKPIATGNISQRGLLFTSETPCQVGGVVEILLALPDEDKEVVCAAKVVRVIEKEQDYEVGVRIINIEGIDHHRFQKHLASLRAE
ncbi:MAG: diguanylate cyclase [Thermoanaerobaculia bacterium]